MSKIDCHEKQVGIQKCYITAPSGGLNYHHTWFESKTKTVP